MGRKTTILLGIYSVRIYIMEYRKVTVKKGSTTLITAHEGDFSHTLRSSSKLVILADIEGWDEKKNDVSTEPKLFGNGSYIVKTRVPEINIGLDVVIFLDKDASYVHTIKDKVVTAINESAENITITREYYSTPTSGTPYRTEKYTKCIVTSIGELERVYDEVVRTTITLLVTDTEMITS